MRTGGPNAGQARHDGAVPRAQPAQANRKGAGVATAVATHPFDVIDARQQTARLSAAANQLQRVIWCLDGPMMGLLDNLELRASGDLNKLVKVCRVSQEILVERVRLLRVCHLLA